MIKILIHNRATPLKKSNFAMHIIGQINIYIGVKKRLKSTYYGD